MERRYALFIAISLAAVLGSQVLRTTLFRQPEEPPPTVNEPAGLAAGEAETAVAGTSASSTSTAEASDLVSTSKDEAASHAAVGSVSAAPRRRVPLGSFDSS